MTALCSLQQQGWIYSPVNLGIISQGNPRKKIFCFQGLRALLTVGLMNNKWGGIGSVQGRGEGVIKFLKSLPKKLTYE